jgi:hypothetical protein
MQRDSIPSEVDYETRQGVYSICLQLARYEDVLIILSRQYFTFLLNFYHFKRV